MRYHSHSFTARCTVRNRLVLIASAALWAMALGWQLPEAAHAGGKSPLDARLERVLADAGFAGRVESSLERRLGRPLDPRLVEAGRLLFFDNVLGLHEDNSCAGCHTPGFGFGDSGSIAIGVQNNGIVGPDRIGPRNQRKAPPIINSAFFPKLMLNGRFVALSGDPFDNSSGFQFPLPEGATRFQPADASVPTLLAAQGHIPQTELVEMAGFTGATVNPLLDTRFHQFDDGVGTQLPLDADADGFLNEEIRSMVLRKLNRIDGYVSRFAAIHNSGEIAVFNITFAMVGQALAEFQTSLTFANAPIDRFARGAHGAMTNAQKRGALLFFGEAGCVECHAVAGRSNEMFSDFENHVLGVPQIAPAFGAGAGNVAFDGPGGDEDFGAEQISGNPADRYEFRTSPLRNAALQPAFFHNGAFTRLEDAIRHHLDPRRSAERYDALDAGVDADLAQRIGPIQPVLERLDPLLQKPIRLSRKEFSDLVEFVRDGLLDPRARPRRACDTVPDVVPSGIPVSLFQGCR
jgi:cytochrome c peroxidase